MEDSDSDSAISDYFYCSFHWAIDFRHAGVSEIDGLYDIYTIVGDFALDCFRLGPIRLVVFKHCSHPNRYALSEDLLLYSPYFQVHTCILMHIFNQNGRSNRI